MKMSGEEIIAAPIENVWAALNDPKILQACIPGCETIKQTSPTDFEARVVIKLGPIKAGFSGKVKLSNLNAPHGYLISGKGEGGIAGFAEGGADVNLVTVPEGTKLSYDVDAKIGGKMAMLGSRLIDSTAQQMAGQFFEKFAKLAAAVKTTAPKTAKKAPAKKAAKKAMAKKPVKKAAAKKQTKKPAKKK